MTHAEAIEKLDDAIFALAIYGYSEDEIIRKKIEEVAYTIKAVETMLQIEEGQEP